MVLKNFHVLEKEPFVIWVQKLVPQHQLLDMMNQWKSILRATGRDLIADEANKIKEYLTGDPEVYQNPEKYFDELIEINLSELEPHINGPFSPDISNPCE